jgi:hypothetical protein
MQEPSKNPKSPSAHEQNFGEDKILVSNMASPLGEPALMLVPWLKCQKPKLNYL